MHYDVRVVIHNEEGVQSSISVFVSSNLETAIAFRSALVDRANRVLSRFHVEARLGALSAQRAAIRRVLWETEEEKDLLEKLLRHPGYPEFSRKGEVQYDQKLE